MYSVWLLPNNDDTKTIRETIKKLCEKYDAPDFTPHITVYSGLEIGRQEIDSAIQKSIDDTCSFTVSKETLSHSDDIWKTVYIELKMNAELENIYKKLQQAFGNHCKYQFKPHISLIYKKISEEKRQEIINEIMIKDEFTIDGICTVKSSYDVSRWEIYKKYEF